MRVFNGADEFCSPAVLKFHKTAPVLKRDLPPICGKDGWSPVNPQRHHAGPAPFTSADNDNARAIVLAASQEMRQITARGTLVGTPQGQVITIPLKNVGLNKRIIIELQATWAQSAAETQTPTQLGLSNFLSNVRLTDFSNIERVNTTGWHLYQLSSLRRAFAYGAAFTNDAPVNMGSTWGIQGPSGAVTTAKTLRWFVEVPLAYNDLNLRGAIYAAVNNGNWFLQFTVNPNFSVASNAADATLACYQSSTVPDLGSLTAVSYKIYQIYLDQIPFNGPNPILPVLDLATLYMLTNTALPQPVAGQDYFIPFANMRSFLSTFCIYDQAGTLNVGNDMNYVAIQVANATYIRNITPYYQALQNRNLVGDDLPKGMYLFETRDKPINTGNYGNTGIVLNPITAAAGTSVLIGWEAFAAQNQLVNAGSLAAAG